MKFRKTILFLMVMALMSALQAKERSTPVFSYKDVKGKMHSLSDYRGKWVVVNYWATWCPPCLDEIPELTEFHEAHYKTDAVVLGINHEDIDMESLKIFIDEYFISYPVLKPPSGSRTPFGRLYGLPSTFIISPEGKLVDRITGTVTRRDLESYIVPRVIPQTASTQKH